MNKTLLLLAAVALIPLGACGDDTSASAGNGTVLDTGVQDGAPSLDLASDIESPFDLSADSAGDGGFPLRQSGCASLLTLLGSCGGGCSQQDSSSSQASACAHLGDDVEDAVLATSAFGGSGVGLLGNLDGQVQRLLQELKEPLGGIARSEQLIELEFAPQAILAAPARPSTLEDLPNSELISDVLVDAVGPGQEGDVRWRVCVHADAELRTIQPDAQSIDGLVARVGDRKCELRLRVEPAAIGGMVHQVEEFEDELGLSGGVAV